jgi:hypothetical protein
VWLGPFVLSASVGCDGVCSQFAIRIPFGLLGLIVAFAFDVCFGVILDDPGDDMLGIKRDRLSKVIYFARKFGLNAAYAFIQEISQGFMRHEAQQTAKVPFSG